MIFFTTFLLRLTSVYCIVLLQFAILHTFLVEVFSGGCKRPGDLAKHSKTTRYLSNYEGEIYMIKVLFICHGRTRTFV